MDKHFTRFGTALGTYDARFYSDAALTQPVHDDVYPEIETDEICDIYFKYQVDTEATDVNGLKLEELVSTAAQVETDVTALQTNGQLKKKGAVGGMEGNWWFMVLDTDEGVTRTVTTTTDPETGKDVTEKEYVGRQLFLRREDDGSIGWMNNDYALHKEAEDNLNQWSYSRLAESYRQGDSDHFREARWLWSLVGTDPYDMRLINLEQAAGVTADAMGIYSLDAAENCYVTIGDVATEQKVNNVTTTVHTYPVTVPQAEPEANCQWGLTSGYGTEKTFGLFSTAITYMDDEGVEVSRPLYWQLPEGTTALTGGTHASDRGNALQLLPYEPVKYEDLRLMVRRKDEVEKYKDDNPTMNPEALNNMETGIMRMYYSLEERMFVEGDRIADMADIPIDARRAFCTYTLWQDDYRNEGGMTVKAGAYRGDPKTDGNGKLLYDDNGKQLYDYYYYDEENQKKTTDPQTIFLSYVVTSDVFLPEHPTQAEVKRMSEENDHVYFMEFPDPTVLGSKKLAYDTGYHAYYDEEATFMDVVGDLARKYRDNNVTDPDIKRSEKRWWVGAADGSDGYWEDDKNGESYNYNKYRFRNTTNRMESAPKNLKWYFVGDPYKVQVYCTQSEFEDNGEGKQEAAQLCRFNPVESNFQGVADCVHLKVPKLDFIDHREKISYYTHLGNVDTTVEENNPDYKKPYFAEFYWEMMESPVAVEGGGGFALRFKADNPVLGYRNVYYYLGHYGLKRNYGKTSLIDNAEYDVNLNYRPNNNRHESGAYTGYHEANNDTTVICLVQPVKVFVTANRVADAENRYAAKSNVVVDELSEYFGLGEQLSDVPRHLKRKFVAYENLTRTDPADGNLLLGAQTNKFKVDYKVDDTNEGGEHLFTTKAEDAAKTHQWVDVEVSSNTWMYYDKTHLNGKTGEENRTQQVSQYDRKTNVTNTSEAVEGWSTGLKGLHWAFIGDPYDFVALNRRRYEDHAAGDACASSDSCYLGTAYAEYKNKEKLKVRDTNTGVLEELTDQYVTYNYARLVPETNAEGAETADADGRKYGEDDNNPEYLQHSSTQTNTLDKSGNGNTRWSLIYCKTGGDNDYFIRTASLKTTPDDLSNGYVGTGTDPRNLTNHYQRLTAKAFATTGDAVESGFVTLPFSLSTKTSEIQKASIRTAVADDNDGAKNDCFDANVTIYNKVTGKRMARLKHVEMRYTNVLDAIPYTLRRYGCNYIECHQMKDVLDVFSEDSPDYVKSFAMDAEFTKGGLDNVVIQTGDECKGYYEIAYLYTVDDDVKSHFTTTDDEAEDDYSWLNAYFQWNQYYSGSNVRTVDYVKVFDHYEYNANGLIEREVYRMEEKVTYKSGTFATPVMGWLNSHKDKSLAYGDETSQSEDDRQKWSLIGDPYDFQLKNYAQYLLDANSALGVGDNGISFSTIESEQAHWAIVQGEQKKELDSNGKETSVWADAAKTIPVYNYYLALIDEETGLATQYVTFDRTADNKDLPAESQNLYLKGGPIKGDPTGNLFVYDGVRPFNLAELMSYASQVQYHLVIAHQHSLDYEDDFSNLSTEEEEKKEARRLIDQHLVEWLKYKHPEYMEKESITVGSKGETAQRATETVLSDYLDGTSTDTHVDGTANGETPLMNQLTDEAKTAIMEHLRQASLRDVVNDSIDDYVVSGVGVGNRIKVPWYMKRQFCNYRLFQRDVLRSQQTNKPQKATDEWKANGGAVLSVTYEGETYDAMVSAQGDTLYEDKWVSVTEQKRDRNGNLKWEDEAKTIPSYADYRDEVLRTNGTEITKLESYHKNRRVLVDVVYEVNTDEFRFADQGRNTTAWYSMVTNSDKDGLLNFSYLKGVGARHDRASHYTNNYLWAPEGDPYGFVLRSRYATINGTGWDNVVVSTTGQLPSKETVKDETLKENEIKVMTTLGDDETEGADDVFTVKEGDEATDNITYTGAVSNARFVDKRIVHFGKGYTRTDGTKVRTWAARNAVYEMFAGDYYRSFLMHPTSAYINTTGDKFSSFYVVHNTSGYNAELRYAADAASIRSNEDANWRLITTPEQLLPYFERAGYVGGLKPTLANHFENKALYATLQNYRDTYRTDPTVIDFKTIDRARKLVYAGNFYARQEDGSYETDSYDYTEPRPSGDDSYKLPLKFVSDNLVPLQQGYYRIRAFSTTALNHDGDVTGGIVGPRYISGYRFQSEQQYAGYNYNETSHEYELEGGSRWLHFFETDEVNTTFKTFGQLNEHIAEMDADATNEGYKTRDITPHPALRGNIPILPAEYDPSSIFYFEPVKPEGSDKLDRYDRYTLSTQGLRVRGRAGGVQPGTTGATNKYGDDIKVDDDKYGMTKLADADTYSGPKTDGAEGLGTFDDRFRLADIGGTAVTLRLLENESDNWDAIAGDNLKTNYLCIDANHRYRITIHKNNEMMEIGDDYSTNEWDGKEQYGIQYGIQDTKWLLQPVGVKTEWPYNEMPLRVAVNKGGQKADADGNPLTGTENEDKNYYASLYVPFDTRLSKTTDVAFTSTKSDPAPNALRLGSVSQLNNMGNPQFIPATWPVILRTGTPVTKVTGVKYVGDGTGNVTSSEVTLTERSPFVELYLPTTHPTTIADSEAKITASGLEGSYLDRELTNDGLTQDPVSEGSTAKRVMLFGLPFVGTNTVNNTHDTAEDYYAYRNEGSVGFYTNENWWRGHTEYSAKTEEKLEDYDSSSTDEDYQLKNAHWAGTASDGTFLMPTKAQRNNKYVYHNKVYYIYTPPASSAKPHFVVIFDGDEELSETEESEEGNDPTDDADLHPWPCDVYDLAGRKVATHETPQTLRQNNPGLPKGVYIFGHRKVVVK